jgi:hypothetical protein
MANHQAADDGRKGISRRGYIFVIRLGRHQAVAGGGHRVREQLPLQERAEGVQRVGQPRSISN